MFNLYAAAGPGNSVADYFKARPDRLRLLSYYREKRILEKRIALGLKTFVDSGAYSAHTKGVTLNVDEYIDWINKNDEYLLIYAQVDKIPGVFRKPKTQEELAEAPELSWQNYLYMRERVKSPDKLLPIFHQGEDFRHLERMLEFKPAIQYIGISPSNDIHTAQKDEWIARCFQVIRNSSNPTVKTHAFGMTALHMLEKYPFYSADSTSWLMTGVNGNIMTKWGTQVVSDVSKGKFDHISNKSQQEYEVMKKYVEDRGYTLEELGTCYKARCRFNLDYLYEWATNYKMTKKPVKQNTLF